MDRPRRFSAAFVNTVTAPGRYGDGRGGFGLSLLVKPTTSGRVSRSWAQRLRIEDTVFNLGLGSFPRVSLSTARKRALTNIRMVEDGGDPRRKPEVTPTFANSMEQSITVLRPGWTGGKTESQMRYLLGEYVLPHIGKRRIDAIQPADVLSFLAPLAIEKAATAKKVKAQIGQVFKWAIAQGLRTDNPADANINKALPKLQTKEHHRALPFSQVPSALKTIEESEAFLGTKLAFSFLVLTASRSGEVRLTTWDEIDLNTATWTIPAGRMKAARQHSVPLADPALAILERARQLSDGTGLVFPSANGRPMTDSTISKLVRENGIQAVPHGFRSSFRNWCASVNIDRQTAELSLAHKVGDATEASYLTDDLFELRREAMTRWAAYLLQVNSFRDDGNS